MSVLRVGVYARVSTSDKDQNPETQLLPLREFMQAQGWTAGGEFVDHASATDLRGRTAWKDLLTLASRRKLDLILVWKLDRAFRSVAHASATLEQFRQWGVGLRSYTEPWADTTSPQGELVFNLLATFAQFEKALIAERTWAGMSRARLQGKHIGRPAVLNGEFEAIRAQVVAGTISQRDAARRLGVSPRTIARALRHKGSEIGPSETLANQGVQDSAVTA